MSEKTPGMCKCSKSSSEIIQSFIRIEEKEILQ